jgi:hypothetical protein
MQSKAHFVTYGAIVALHLTARRLRLTSGGTVWYGI